MKKYNLDPTKTKAIIVSHCHTDHYNDAEVLVEAMTNGGTQQKGSIFGSESVINGANGIGPGISAYHQTKAKDVRALQSGDKTKIGRMVIEATPTFHSDPTGIGLKLWTNEGVVSYTSDTELKDEIIGAHKNTRVLIMSVTRPLEARIPHHMTTEDAAILVNEIQPELAIMTHLGIKFLRSKPNRQAEWVKKETGVETIAARDGMSLKIGTELTIS